MALRVVGAGLARTGTSSLKQALQMLLGGACYHMSEVFPRPDHVRADWDKRRTPVGRSTTCDTRRRRCCSGKAPIPRSCPSSWATRRSG